MPYFERLPYAEMIVRNSADHAHPPANPTTIEPSILEQAAAILKEESGGLPSSSAGRVKFPFLDADAGQPKGIAGTVLLLEPPPPVKAGQIATVVLSIVNDSGTSLSFSMMATHLVSRSGARIAATNIDISPEEAVLAPSEAVDVQVAVNVPEIVIPDEYGGLLQAFGQETVRAVLVINVTN